MNDILTVTALNDQIKDLLEARFDLLWVTGEVSNLRRPASGHVYFTLKDEKSQIRAVIFRAPFGQAHFPGKTLPAFALEEGLSILCRVRLSVYQPRGEYQLIVDKMEPQGVGALQKAYEQLKARLEQEGLFAPSAKQPIPFLPRIIGVITSPTGAVIRDILTITGRRFSSIPILIAPVRVQGDEAATDIVQALLNLQASGAPDVIIIARGGGSLEDLAPFNDERVARAIFRSAIPVISAVGHETDFTIADFVADLRAPTPSAAAELAVPLRLDLMTLLASLHRRLTLQQKRTLERLRERIVTLQERLRDPRKVLTDGRLSLDDQLERLQRAFLHCTTLQRRQLAYLTVCLRHTSPLASIGAKQNILENLRKSMIAGTLVVFERLRYRLCSQAGMLEAFSPLAVLSRGFSIARRLPEGGIIRLAGEVAPGNAVDIKVASGRFTARVIDVFGEE
jgi:exodeoxyribonuclease VII large subunit